MLHDETHMTDATKWAQQDEYSTSGEAWRVNLSGATLRVLRDEFTIGDGTRRGKQNERIMAATTWQVKRNGPSGTTGYT